MKTQVPKNATREYLRFARDTETGKLVLIKTVPPVSSKDEEEEMLKRLEVV